MGLREWFAGLRGRVIVPALRLNGVIGTVGVGDRGLSLMRLERQIDALFASKKAPAAVLLINSPGGSAAQSALIAQRIRALAEEKKRPVLAFCEDVAASGGYWLACAADEIFADPASIVGSIGVVSAGFGFTDAIARIGIERRVHTAGRRKALLDPFRPEREEDLVLLKEIQGEIHGMFKDWVRQRRGDRLGNDPDLFEGRVWSGARGKELGLVDGLGDPRTVIRARFGPKARIVTVNPARTSLLRRLRGGVEAGHMVGEAVALLEERAHWQRFGL
ncbi:MAG: S49 family peptidase [Geminicoccaceae bacterium]